MAANRIYEVIFIINPATPEEEASRLVETLQNTIRDQGGSVIRSESMGRRALAYEIEHQREGNFHFFEIEGTGREIAELERRMRVSDPILRFLTVRVDEDRRRAEKLRARRARRAGQRAGRHAQNAAENVEG